MKKLIIIFVLAVLGFAGYRIATLGPGDEALIGVWQNEESTLEFKPDGTWESMPKKSDKPIKIWGTYTLTGSGSIVMRYSDPPLPSFEHEHKIKLHSNSKMTLYAYDGDPRKFTKKG